LDEPRYKVVGVTLFGKLEAGRFPTLEQAERRAEELNGWSERHPRGYVRYLVKPVDQGGDRPSLWRRLRRREG
jgi:hypothetical protein